MSDYHDEYEPYEPHHQGGGGHRHPQAGRDGFSEGVSKQDVNRFAEDAFRKSADAMGNAQLGETKKLFGLFTVDAGIAAWAQTAYNMGADYFATNLAPKAGSIAKQLGAKAGLQGNKLDNTAAIAQIGSIAALKTAGYFGQVIEAHSMQRKQRVDLARSIAPVLDDLKGSHSLGALYSVTQADNEVIFAHRKRLARIASTENTSRWVDLAINAGPNMLLDGKRFKAIWQEKGDVSLEQIRLQEEVQKHEAQMKADVGEIGDGSQGKLIFSGLLNTGLPQVAERISKTGQYNLCKQLQPYSALEMILELNEQVASNPESRGFQVPPSFQSPRGHREQYGLEEYVMRIFIQHQKDMADISPNHTEIREALRQDLASVAKPIAAAIRSGDMSAMSLVRMVGEGKVIKKNGRGIAPVEEVTALIKREAPKQASYLHVDPAEYYKDAAFTRAQLKTALKSLDGEEKLLFSAMFPDSVLEEAGMSAKDVKSMREATAKHYDQKVAEAIAGLNVKSDDALKNEGLAENEVQQVRAAQASIEEAGIEAVKHLKTSATNENGIEHLLTNAVVHKPEYLGKLVKAGHELLAEAANDDNHAARETRRQTMREAEAANDDVFAHAANGR